MTRPQTGPPPFPERLERNLRSYRRTMRRTKLTEHFAVALTALVASFLVVAALDRLFDTNALLRGCSSAWPWRSRPSWSREPCPAGTCATGTCARWPGR